MATFAARIASLLAGLVFALPAAAQTWTGAGPNDNWSTGANWSGGVPPASSPVTQLAFPAGTPRLASVVDAPWTVNRLDFTGSGHTLSGQPITFDGAGALISGQAFVTVANPVVLAVPIQVTGSPNILTITGVVSGPGSLNVAGTGNITLTAVNTFTGGTLVSGAVLRLDGAMPGPVTVNLAGILTGHGAVAGVVTMDATGNLDPDLVLGTGNLGMAAGSNLIIEIDGTARGTQYAGVDVTGLVDVSGATLNLRGSYTPAPGDVFTIIANQGIAAVTGTFAGLPEGSTVTFNGVPLRISYVGGTGNDVTLTALAAVAVTDVRQVPTLSEWALLLLVSLMLGIGMMRARRRP
jgi:autotransporter-associated beta strand protein